MHSKSLYMLEEISRPSCYEKEVTDHVQNWPYQMPAILLTVLLLSAALLGSSGCAVLSDGKAEARKLPPPAERVDPGLAAANTRFSLKLFKELAGNSAENIFLSPASVSLCLAMIYNGAAGETARAMAETLELQGMSLEEINRAYADLRSILLNPDPEVELDIANSLWARQGEPFKDDFLNRNKQYYHAAVEELDFDRPEAADTINGWVQEQTRGKIKEIVEKPISPDTIMFVMNAIYFKGSWTDKFDPKTTREIPFHTAGGSVKNHPVMFRYGEYRYLEERDFQAVSLPYGKGGRVSMYVFLPREGLPLQDFFGQMNEASWEAWMNSFLVMEGDLGLPRFSFEYEVSLNGALKALGMEAAFDSSRADFSGMYPATTSQNVYLSEVKHKTFINVNEEGSEAAAVTSGEMRVTSMPQTFIMTVDRPFCFAIRDNLTGSILFIGSVADPH